jgi:hypothetical protein
MITQEQIESRKAICNACDDLVKSMYPTCNYCACPITYLVPREDSRCSIGKWEAVMGESG